LDQREKLKATAGGLMVPRFGKHAVVVDAERSLADVIGSLVHELGHVRQVFLNPTQGQGSSDSYYRKAVQEAGAQQFERAFWLKLEEFTDLTILAYPEYQGFKDMIESNMDLWSVYLNEDEHFLGYLLQWLAVLDDPNLVDLKNELTAQSQLGAEASLDLYIYLVRMAPESIEAYVTSRIHALDTYWEAIKELARGRLVSSLHPDSEGSRSLREAGLLAP